MLNIDQLESVLNKPDTVSGMMAGFNQRMAKIAGATATITNAFVTFNQSASSATHTIKYTGGFNKPVTTSSHIHVSIGPFSP